jgi:hypothetical protein
MMSKVVLLVPTKKMHQKNIIMQNETVSYINPTVDSDDKDRQLWAIAKRRAAFKISAFTYFIVNSMLIAIWYFTTGADSYFWPIWSMLGWGVGIATQYFHAYHGNDIFSVQKEYEQLKKQQ